MATPLYTIEPDSDLKVLNTHPTYNPDGKKAKLKEVTTLADKLSKEELIDRMIAIQNVLHEVEAQKEWLLRLVETSNDIDESEVYRTNANLLLRIDNMVSSGGSIKTMDTLISTYDEETVKEFCKFYPRKWNIIRNVLMDFCDKNNKTRPEEWKKQGIMPDRSGYGVITTLINDMEQQKVKTRHDVVPMPME